MFTIFSSLTFPDFRVLSNNPLSSLLKAKSSSEYSLRKLNKSNLKSLLTFSSLTIFLKLVNISFIGTPICS